MTDEAALEAFRLADSFLPVGTYTVSYGLEQFIQNGRVTDATDLEELLTTYLRRKLATTELVALRHAHAGAVEDDLKAVRDADGRLTAVTMAAEFRRSSRQSGRRLLTLQRELDDAELLERYADGLDDGSGNYAVVLGVVTGLAGIDEREACRLCCHGFVTGLLGAAQRLLSLGHTDVQRILCSLQPTMAAAIDDSAERTLAELTSFTPLVDIHAAEHERADRRLFSS